MHVTITVNSPETTTSTMDFATPEVEAASVTADAGAAPGSANGDRSAAADETSGAADGGGPPQWLLDAVAAAEAADLQNGAAAPYRGAAGDMTDAGPGPAV